MWRFSEIYVMANLECAFAFESASLDYTEAANSYGYQGIQLGPKRKNLQPCRVFFQSEKLSAYQKLSHTDLNTVNLFHSVFDGKPVYFNSTWNFFQEEAWPHLRYIHKVLQAEVNSLELFFFLLYKHHMCIWMTAATEGNDSLIADVIFIFVFPCWAGQRSTLSLLWWDFWDKMTNAAEYVWYTLSPQGVTHINPHTHTVHVLS